MNMKDTLDLNAAGTSDGAKKAWEVRQRGADTFRPKKSLDELHAIFSDAGNAYKTVLLSYHKEEDEKPKAYKIEPYSYRGDKLFAYDVDAKSIKAFKLLRIADAKIGDTNFKPRWPVELKAEAIRFGVI